MKKKKFNVKEMITWDKHGHEVFTVPLEEAQEALALWEKDIVDLHIQLGEMAWNVSKFRAIVKYMKTVKYEENYN